MPCRPCRTRSGEEGQAQPPFSDALGLTRSAGLFTKDLLDCAERLCAVRHPFVHRRSDNDPDTLGSRFMLESYTMLTVNADAHPLMSRMHKPDPKLGPDQQDKRSFVLLKAHDFDQWLAGTLEEARQLINLTPVEAFDAAPAEGSP
jgi:hypothetical protein